MPRPGKERNLRGQNCFSRKRYIAPYGALRSGVAIEDGLRPSLNYYSAYGLILPGSQSRSLWDSMILSRQRDILLQSPVSYSPVGPS